MEFLTLAPNGERPTAAQAQAMCRRISLERQPALDARLDAVLDRIRTTDANGGALFATFNVGPDEVFDWFASGDGLSMFGILRQLFDRSEVNSALSELDIQPLKPDDPALVIHKLGDYGHLPPSVAAHGITEDVELGNSGYEGEFQVVDTFLFDGELARVLYEGGLLYTR